jgi:hypothetical protein
MRKNRVILHVIPVPNISKRDGLNFYREIHYLCFCAYRYLNY